MKRFIRSATVACTALALAGVVWTAIPASASSLTPPEQVDSYYNAVAKAGSKFVTEFKAEVADYGSVSEETFASNLAEQTYDLATPLQNEQAALLNLMLNVKISAKTRLASAVLATTITRFVYLLGVAGYAAGGSTGIENWAKTFQSTKLVYQSQGKTVLTDLGYKVTS